MTATKIRHGRTGYVHHGCRCPECTGAQRVYQRTLRARYRATALAPNDPRHGTNNGYQNHGCRCAPCAEAGCEYLRSWRAARREVAP